MIRGDIREDRAHFLRSLSVSVWTKVSGGKTLCLGEAQLAVDRMQERSTIRGWYRLFPPQGNIQDSD